MPSNYTPNYQLNQWEPEDKVLRADFNRDNIRLEAALTAADSRAGTLDSWATNLAYYVGCMALRDYVTTRKIPPIRSLLCDDFNRPGVYTITGDAAVADGMLTLSGAGKTATATAGNWALGVYSWHKALLWVHYSRGDVSASMNGKEMKMQYAGFGYSPNQQKDCFEELFVLEVPEGERSGQISLHLSCINDPVSVYDWFAFFV